MAKPPAFQMYPGDWTRDPGIQSLTYEERGIWFTCLCFMHFSEPRGKLAVNGRDLDDDEIAHLLHIDGKKWKQVRGRLVDRGVAKVDPDTGGIFSARMYGETWASEMKRRAGKAGAKARWNSKRMADPKANGKQKGKAKMAASSSTSERNKKERMAESNVENSSFEENRKAQKEIVNRILKEAETEDDLPPPRSRK